MSTLTVDLQTSLNHLDRDSASKLEKLVRDAIDLAQPPKSTPAEVDEYGWPLGYWEKFAGCMADEEWDLPDDPPPGPTPVW